LLFSALIVQCKGNGLKIDNPM